MDEQATDGPSQPQASPTERSDPADAPARVLAARPKADAAGRVAEFRLSDDGQLLEAGYGHGV